MEKIVRKFKNDYDLEKRELEGQVIYNVRKKNSKYIIGSIYEKKDEEIERIDNEVSYFINKVFINFKKLLEARFIEGKSVNDIHESYGYYTMNNLLDSRKIVKSILGEDYVNEKINIAKVEANKNLFNKVRLTGDIIESVHSRLGVSYKWKLKLEYDGKQYTFTFTNSISEGTKRPKVKDVIYCLISDRSCYLQYEDDIEGFAMELCEGKSYGEVAPIYNGCKRTAEALERVFGNDLKWFEKELEDY